MQPRVLIMSYNPGAPLGNEYEQWNDESSEDEARFLGTISDRATPSYYVPEEHRVESGYIDESGELVTHPDGDSFDLDPEQELGEFLEQVGEDHGWESLSEWAREHLEDGSSDQ